MLLIKNNGDLFHFFTVILGENLHCQPLQRPYKSRVLANYPDSLPWNPIDKDAVGMVSLNNYHTKYYIGFFIKKGYYFM